MYSAKKFEELGVELLHKLEIYSDSYVTGAVVRSFLIGKSARDYQGTTGSVRMGAISIFM